MDSSKVEAGTNKIVIVACAGVAAVFGMYFWVFWSPEFGDVGTWGQFGDYVGGLLNPFIAGLALLVLAATLRDNKRAVDELQKQTRITRSIAYAERLGRYADQVYLEIQRHVSDGSFTAAVERQSDGTWHNAMVFQALKSAKDRPENFRYVEEWRGSGDWSAHLKTAIRLLDELAQYCTLSHHATETNEVTLFYFRKVEPYWHGAALLGYFSQERFDRLRLASEGVMPPLKAGGQA